MKEGLYSKAQRFEIEKVRGVFSAYFQTNSQRCAPSSPCWNSPYTKKILPAMFFTGRIFFNKNLVLFSSAGSTI